MRSGERVERVVVIGEWEVENEWGGQRCPENWKREKLERRDRTMRHRVLDAVSIVCPKFLFLKKKRRRRRFPSYRRRIISMMSIISIISMISIISIYRSLY